MLKLLYKFFILILLNYSIFAKAESIDDITWVTENYPPYNFLDNTGTATGISVNIVEQILSAAKSKKTIVNIISLPWSQAYNSALSSPNYAIFSIAKTEFRENLFKWIGPITTSKIIALAKKSLDIKLNNKAELNNYRVAAVSNDIAEQLVTKELGTFNYIPVASLEQAIQALRNNQTQIIIGDYNVISYLMLKNKFNFDEYEVLLELKNIDYWIAFNPNTSDELIKKIQVIFNSLE